MIRCHVQNLAMVSAVLAFAGCQSHQGDQPQAAENTTQQITERPDANPEKTVEGTVTHTENGKDGFTATIETQKEGLYQVTVSRANLQDPKQFRHFNEHEIVKVRGDFWTLEQKAQITVREIL